MEKHGDIVELHWMFGALFANAIPTVQCLKLYSVCDGFKGTTQPNRASQNISRLFNYLYIFIFDKFFRLIRLQFCKKKKKQNMAIMGHLWCRPSIQTLIDIMNLISRKLQTKRKIKLTTILFFVVATLLSPPSPRAFFYSSYTYNISYLFIFIYFIL